MVGAYYITPLVSFPHRAGSVPKHTTQRWVVPAVENAYLPRSNFMRKVYININTRVIVEMDEGIDVDEVIQEMDYSFISQTEGAIVHDTEIRDYEVTDSK